MESSKEMPIEELIASYTDLLAKHGPHSAEAEKFLAEHRSVPEFAELAETANHLHELYGTKPGGRLAGLPLPIRGSRSFFERLVDFRVAALVVIAVTWAAASMTLVNQLEASRQLSARLSVIQAILNQERGSSALDSSELKRIQAALNEGRANYALASSELKQLPEKLDKQLTTKLQQVEDRLRMAVVADVKKVISETAFVSLPGIKGETAASLRGAALPKGISIKELEGATVIIPIGRIVRPSEGPAAVKAFEPVAPGSK